MSVGTDQLTELGSYLSELEEKGDMFARFELFNTVFKAHIEKTSDQVLKECISANIRNDQLRSELLKHVDSLTEWRNWCDRRRCKKSNCTGRT